MGEMADFFLEQVEEHEYARLRYRLGDMDDLEAYELGIIDERGAEYTPGRRFNPSPGAIRTPFTLHAQRTITCRHCGKTGLIWKQFPQGWRTTNPNTGEMHDCPAFKRNP